MNGFSVIALVNPKKSANVGGVMRAAQCMHTVQIDTRHCMNLAAIVNVVLYDRLAKESRNGTE